MFHFIWNALLQYDLQYDLHNFQTFLISFCNQ